jgi:hypothetical protein
VNALYSPTSPELLQPPSQQQYPLPTTWTESFHFSAMSDNEIIKTVMDVGDFNSSLLELPIQDPNAFMWMEWANPLDSGFQ